MSTLSLQRTAAGWGLFDARDRTVFEAPGRDGRNRCLKQAIALGVLHLRFDEQLHAA